MTVISKGISKDISKGIAEGSKDQPLIHPTAIVESGVELGADVEIGPYSYIRSGAKIGARSKIHSHVNIWGESVIGEENEFYPYCVVGAPPQILGAPNPQARTIIGNKNVFRECVQVHRGSSRENSETRVGNENYIMTAVHIAHDCVIGNKVVVATQTGLAGHSKIHDSAIVSGACGVSQHVRIGTFTFCAGMTRFQRDLPPFMCAKEFCVVTGPNIVGMKRAGFSEADIRVAKEIYKALFVNKGLLKVQLKTLQERFAGQPVFETFNTFLEGTKVGIMRNG